MGEFKYIAMFVIIGYYVYSLFSKLSKAKTPTDADVESQQIPKTIINDKPIKKKQKSTQTETSKKKVASPIVNSTSEIETPIYKEYKIEPEKNEYLEKMKNPQTIKDAVIISEILNKKYN